MKTYTEEEVVESLFTAGGTLANEGIEIKAHRKNAKNIYFNYKGTEYCFNGNNVICKFSEIEGKRYFTYAVLDFNTHKEYNEVVEALKVKLGR